MVAKKATFLRAEQILIKGEKSFVYFEDIVYSVFDMVFDDDIESAGFRKGISRLEQ